MDISNEAITIVRNKIGESIPVGGTAEDTLFTEQQIQLWIQAAPTINHAIVEGWETKIAHWANLVDVTDGASSRKMGALITNGEARLKYYRGLIIGGDSLARSRTRVGKIVRRG